MCIFDFGGGEQVEQDVFYYMKASSLKEYVTDSCYPSLSSTSLHSYGKLIGAVENNPHCQ